MSNIHNNTSKGLRQQVSLATRNIHSNTKLEHNAKCVDDQQDCEHHVIHYDFQDESKDDQTPADDQNVTVSQLFVDHLSHRYGGSMARVDNLMIPKQVLISLAVC